MSGFIDGRNGFIDGRIYEKGFATQRLVLRTDQAATMIATVAFGHHAVFLIRVDRDVGRDVPLGQQLTEGAFAVAGVRNPATPQARYKLTRDTSDNSETAFDSRSEAWAPRGGLHTGVPTPADDDVLMRNTSVINNASVSTRRPFSLNTCSLVRPCFPTTALPHDRRPDQRTELTGNLVTIPATDPNRQMT